MGGCFTGQKLRRPEKPKPGKIDINCPICEENYDVDEHKPYVVCGNKHKLCLACLSSMKNHASLKKSPLLCPFCKASVEEDMVVTDTGIYNFLDAELDTLKRLPQEKRKLFAFSSIYLPQLHNFMKQEVKRDAGGGIAEKKSSERVRRAGNSSIQSIEVLRIKGRMLQEYEVFEMEMLNCMACLHKIYLNSNHIRAIDITNFTLTKLTLIDISHNRISTLKNIFLDSTHFSGLKVLIARNNLIQESPALKNSPNLQVINLKNNKLQSLRWFQECQALRHLDLEFNNITQVVEFPANFAQLYSLLMFGNSIDMKCWDNFAKLQWKDLRLLTATIGKASLLEKYNIHNRIAKLPAACLKLLVFEMALEQPESQVAQNAGMEKQNRVKKLQLNAENYLFYTENESFLKESIYNVIRSHPFGRNFNFKPIQLNNKVYEEDETSNTYKKIAVSNEPADYLSSIPVKVETKGRTFISFLTKSTKILIGVREKNLAQNKIEVNVDREIVIMGKEEHPCKSFKSSLPKNKEFEVCIGLSLQQGNVSFMVGNTVLDNYYFTDPWSDYRFYVHVGEIGQSIKFIRDEIDL